MVANYNVVEQLEKWPAPYRGEVPAVIEKYLDRLAYKVVVQGKNLIFAFLGDVGTGKSWGAVNFARLFDPWFSLDKIVYEADEFFDALDSVRHRGEVIVWDEAGVGMSAREWFSLFNRVVSKTLQIFREATPGRIILIFATPRKIFMDKTARLMLNAEWRFRWEVGELHPYAVPYELYRTIHYRTKTMEDYTVYRLPVVQVGRLVVKIKRIYMASLPSDIAEAYVQKSVPRKHELRFLYAMMQALGDQFPNDVARWLYRIVEEYGYENFLIVESPPPMIANEDRFKLFALVLKEAVSKVGDADDKTYYDEFLKYFERNDIARKRFVRYFVRWLKRREVSRSG